MKHPKSYTITIRPRTGVPLGLECSIADYFNKRFPYWSAWIELKHGDPPTARHFHGQVWMQVPKTQIAPSHLKGTLTKFIEKQIGKLDKDERKHCVDVRYACNNWITTYCGKDLETKILSDNPPPSHANYYKPLPHANSQRTVSHTDLLALFQDTYAANVLHAPPCDTEPSVTHAIYGPINYDPDQPGPTHAITIHQVQRFLTEAAFIQKSIPFLSTREARTNQAHVLYAMLNPQLPDNIDLYLTPTELASKNKEKIAATRLGLARYSYCGTFYSTSSSPLPSPLG